MARADFVDVQIDLTALFERRVHLLYLEAHGLTLRLEDRVDGKPNWRFFDRDGESAGWSFMIEGLQLVDSEILATIGNLAPIDLQIPEMTEVSDASGNLHLVGSGTLNGDPWRVDGNIGTLEQLLVAGRITLDLDLGIDDVDLEIAGSIGDLGSLTDLDLTLNIYGPDADVLGEIFRAPEAFIGDVALVAAISPAGDGHALKATGHIAAFQIETEGTIRDLSGLDGWDGSIDVRGPDAGVFGKTLQITGFPEGPFSFSGNIHRHGGDLDLTGIQIVTESFEAELNADFEQFPRRDGAVANIHLGGSNIAQLRELLRVPSLPAVPFDLTLTLQGTNGDLSAALSVGSHRLDLAGYLGEFPDYLGTRLNTTLRGEDIAAVVRLAGVEDALNGRYAVSTIVTNDEFGLSASSIEFENGPFRLTGDANLPQFGSTSGATIEGNLAISDLQQAGRLFDINGLPSEPASISAGLRIDDDYLHLDHSDIRYLAVKASATGKVDVPARLAGLEARVELEGPALGQLFGVPVPDGQTPLPFTIGAVIAGRETAIELSEFRLESDGGDISANGIVSLAEGNVGTRLMIRGSGSNLAETIPVFPDYIPPKEPWELEADISLPNKRNINLERSFLHAGSVDVQLIGTLDTIDQLSTDLTFQARGNSIRELGQFGDVQLPDIPFSVETKLDGTPTGINVTRLTAEWGESDLEATGSVLLGEIPDVTLTGRSDTMILVDLQKALFGEPEDEEPEDDSTTFFADAPIPLNDLHLFNADIDIEIANFTGSRVHMNEVALALNVVDGALQLERLAYRDRFGSFNATASLKPENDAAVLELRVAGDDANLGFFVSPQQDIETVPRYTMDIDIRGTGATVADLAGSLTGKVLLSSEGGQIDNALLELFAGDFLSNVLETLNPFAETSEFTDMQCLVVNATLDDGQLDLEPGFVMRTDRVNMFVFGDIDLKKERLDLSLATQARRGIGISAASITNPYFKVGGTLMSPQLQLDPASAALAASVATATAGLSIVIRGLWDRLMGERNPCPHFLNYKRKESASPDSSSEG
jgi:hypothetical protein